MNLFEIFDSQKTRGQQGAGISVANPGEDLFRFRSTSPFRLFNAYNYPVWMKIKQGSKVLIHHRYPTSSENKPKFNHPIANEDRTVHVIHNGILVNDNQLYDRLKDSHTFETKEGGSRRFTDTEVIVHVFEEVYKGKKDNIVAALEHVYKTIKGSFALAFLIKDVDRIFLMRNTMPIIISKDDEGNHYFSSELDSFSKLSRVCELEEGEVGVLDGTGYHKLKAIEPDPENRKKAAKIEKQRKKWWKENRKSNWHYDNSFGFVDYDSIPYGSGKSKWRGYGYD